MAFDLQVAATVAKVGFVLTPIILVLFLVQSIWGAVDAKHPTNPVSSALQKAGMYKAVGGQNSAAAPDPSSGAAIDTAGFGYSIVMALMSSLLLVAYGFGVYYAIRLEKFNPFVPIE
jgi:hypothetical protein